MCESIWQKNVSLPSFPQLKNSLNVDVLIVGGGLAGILCAWEMQARGIPYALIESGTVCSGITQNTTAKITVQHGLIYQKILRKYGAETAQRYYAANQKALETYAALAGKTDCDFSYQDNYLYALHSSQELEAEMKAMEQLKIPFSFAKGLPLPFPTAGAIRMEKQAQFHPLKFVSGIVQGLNIYEHTKAKEFIGNTVVTEYGKIHASKILIATHFPILNKHGGYFLKMYQDRSYVIALENAGQLDGMYLDASGKGLSFRNQGDVLLLGGGGHRTGKKGTGWQELRNAGKQFYPNSREICHWAAQDCMTLDGIPYIGRYGKQIPDVYVATGFNKWGMTSSMVAASILADLIQEKENPFARCFTPQRSSFHSQLAVNALESTVNLLTPVTPRCPHLGCALKWNPQEHSWDCPCHGSRFAEDGALLDGPATGDLPKKEK